MAILTVILEEHHEAFFCWNVAAQRGLLKPTGNLLIHVDQHSDLALPRFDCSLWDAIEDFTTFRDFVYRQLTISNFVVPALYIGLFDEMLWVQADCAIPKSTEGYLGSFEGRGLALEAGNAPFDTVDSRKYTLAHQSLRHSFPDHQSWALDIDLDFFSCDEGQTASERIEITRDEYERIASNRYHFLRLMWGSLLALEVVEGRYFLRYNSFKNSYPSEMRVPRTVIRARVEQLRRAVSNIQNEPQIVTISRSRFSGFTPHDQWEYIEACLLDSLSKLFELDVIQIDSFRQA